MIQGTVINNGTNHGTQNGVAVLGGSFLQGHWARRPMIDGAVVNNGTNYGVQNGVRISGGYFRQY